MERGAPQEVRDGTTATDEGRFPWVATIGLMLVAALLLFYGLTATSLWIDEAFGLKFIGSDRGFLALILEDVHPPLYYALLVGWLSVFGTTEWTIRSLSVLFAVATVPVVVAIGRRLGDDRRALLGGLLFAVFPLHLQYGSEGRMYALLVFAAALVMLGALEFARAIADLSRARRGALISIAGSVVAIFSQVMGALLPASAALFMALAWWFGGRPRVGVLAFLAAHLVFAAALALWVPLVAVLLSNAANHAHWWFPNPSLRHVAEVFGVLLGQKVNVTLGLAGGSVAACVVAGMALLGIWSMRRDRVGLAFLGCFLVLPFVVTLAASVLVRPVFILRVHLWALIPLAIVLAHAVFATTSLRLRTVSAATLAGILLTGVYGHHFVWKRPDWRTTLAVVQREAGPGDLVLVPGALGVQEIVRFYAPDIVARTVLVSDEAGLRAAAAEAQGRKVWLVSPPWHDRVPRPQVARALAASHTLGETLPFHRIDLLRFRPASGTSQPDAARNGTG